MEPDHSPARTHTPAELQALFRSIANWTRFLGMAILFLSLLVLFVQNTQIRQNGLTIEGVVSTLGMALLFLASFKLFRYSTKLSQSLRSGTVQSLTTAMRAHRSFWKHWFFYALTSAVGMVIALVNAEW